MSRKSRNLTFKTRIGVLSDTHIPSQAKRLTEELMEQLAKVDFIIHAGDIEDINTLKELRRISRVVAVSGNMDTKKVKNELRRILCRSITKSGRKARIRRNASLTPGGPSSRLKTRKRSTELCPSIR